MKFLSIFNKIFIPFITITVPLFILAIVLYVDLSSTNNPFLTKSNQNHDVGKILFICFYIVSKINFLNNPIASSSIVFGGLALLALINAIVLWAGFRSKGPQVTSLVFTIFLSLILIGFSVFIYLFKPNTSSISSDFSGSTWPIIKDMKFTTGYASWIMYTIAGLSGFTLILIILQIIFVSKFNRWKYFRMQSINGSINSEYESKPNDMKLLKLKKKITKMNMNANNIAGKQESFDRVAKKKIDKQYKKQGKYVRTLTKEEALAEKRNLKSKKRAIKNERKKTFANPLKHQTSHTKVNSMKGGKSKQEIDFEKQRQQDNIILDKKIVDKTKVKQEKSLSAKSINDADKIFNITSKTRQQFQSNLNKKGSANNAPKSKKSKWDKKKSESIYSLDK